MTAYLRRLLTRLSAARAAGNSDRGSVSLWVVMFAFVTLALLILVVDGGQVIIAKSRAADIAEQAAGPRPTPSTRARSARARSSSPRGPAARPARPAISLPLIRRGSA